MPITLGFIPGPRLIDGSDLNAMIAQINQSLESIGPQSGPVYFVNASIGNDGVLAPTGATNTGLNPAFPLATLDQALALESAALTALGLSSVGRNAVVAFWGTQHRTSTLAWNLPATHLIGLSNGIRRGQRARISVTGTVGFNQLVLVTGQGCLFQNFQTFYGWPNSSSALINWEDDAGRNCYNNVEFLGFGDGTATTGSAALTGSRAFKFNSSNGESSWYNCLFGCDTEPRTVANYTLEIAGGAPRLHFENCTFEADIVSGGASGSHVLIGAAGIDRYVKFKSCDFSNCYPGTGSTVVMTQALNISTSAGGNVILDQCVSVGATKLQTTPTTNVLMNMTAATTTGGVALEVF